MVFYVYNNVFFFDTWIQNEEFYVVCGLVFLFSYLTFTVDNNLMVLVMLKSPYLEILICKKNEIPEKKIPKKMRFYFLIYSKLKDSYMFSNKSISNLSNYYQK